MEEMGLGLFDWEAPDWNSFLAGSTNRDGLRRRNLRLVSEADQAGARGPFQLGLDMRPRSILSFPGSATDLRV